MQANYAKVTSAADDDIDHLVRAYGSLAAEVDPEDRLKLLEPRRSRRNPTLQSAVRRLESESGAAPSRSSQVPPAQPSAQPPAQRDQRAQLAQPAQPIREEAKKEEAGCKVHVDVPPQVLGRSHRQDEVHVRMPDSDVGWEDAFAHDLLKQIELPPSTGRDVSISENEVSVASRDAKFDALDAELSPGRDVSISENEVSVASRDAKFDALDAELAEHCQVPSSGFDSSCNLPKSLGGLPKAKKSQKVSGKDRSSKASQSQATNNRHDHMTLTCACMVGGGAGRQLKHHSSFRLGERMCSLESHPAASQHTKWNGSFPGCSIWEYSELVMPGTRLQQPVRKVQP